MRMRRVALAAPALLLAIAGSQALQPAADVLPPPDNLWLRYDLVPDRRARLFGYRTPCRTLKTEDEAAAPNYVPFDELVGGGRHLATHTRPRGGASALLSGQGEREGRATALLSAVSMAAAAAAPQGWNASKWELVLLTDAAKTGARCLDGSPGGYQIRRGKPGNERWVVFHQGGGWVRLQSTSLFFLFAASRFVDLRLDAVISG